MGADEKLRAGVVVIFGLDSSPLFAALYIAEEAYVYAISVEWHIKLKYKISINISDGRAVPGIHRKGGHQCPRAESEGYGGGARVATCLTHKHHKVNKRSCSVAV